jgi:hypothetical protein
MQNAPLRHKQFKLRLFYALFHKNSTGIATQQKKRGMNLSFALFDF